MFSRTHTLSLKFCFRKLCSGDQSGYATLDVFCFGNNLLLQLAIAHCATICQ